MGIYEEQGESAPLIHDRVSGGIPPVTPSLLPQQKRSPIGGVFTTIYFMPDGDALIRYQKRSDENKFLALQAFCVIRVIPSVNGAAPEIEFIKTPNVVVVPPQEEQ